MGAVLCGSSSCPLKWTLDRDRIIQTRMLDFGDTYSPEHDWVRQNFVVNHQKDQQLRLNLQTDMQLDDSMDADVVKHRAFRPYALLSYRSVPTYNSRRTYTLQTD